MLCRLCKKKIIRAFDGVTNELTNLVCEVQHASDIPYLKCTSTCGSIFSGRALSDAERFYMIPEEVEASKVSLEYANRLIRFKGTIRSIKSQKAVIKESGKVTIFGATSCIENNSYLFVGMLESMGSDIYAYIDMDSEVKSAPISWSVDGYVNIDGAGSVKVEGDEGENVVADGGVVKLTATLKQKDMSLSDGLSTGKRCRPKSSILLIRCYAT